MAPLSSDVSAGDDVLASQYNNLRKDVLDPTTGHDHEGVEGIILDGAIAIAIGTITEDRLTEAVIKKLMNFRTARVTAVTPVSLTTVLDLTTTKGVLNGVEIIPTDTGLTAQIRVTIDGVIIVDQSVSVVGAEVRPVALSSGGRLGIGAQAVVAGDENVAFGGIQMWFIDSLKVEVKATGSVAAHHVLYATNI